MTDLDKIASAWDEFRGTETTPISDARIAQERELFPPFRRRAMQKFAAGTFGGWGNAGFIVPAPVTTVQPHLYPVILPVVFCDDSMVKLTIRIALFWWAETIHEEGWRFETGDDYMPGNTTYKGHYRHHVQRITKWHKSGPTGLTADKFTADKLNESPTSDPGDELTPIPFSEDRPAITLPSHTPPGLMLAAAVALHGAKAAEQIIESAAVDNALLREFRTVAYPPER